MFRMSYFTHTFWLVLEKSCPNISENRKKPTLNFLKISGQLFCRTHDTKYSRIDQGKPVENSF